MTKEEKIKIFSAFLPYGLHVMGVESAQLGNDSSVLTRVEKTHLLSGVSNGYAVFDNSNLGNPIELVKPILYDLSYLTKEIEHNGERIIPILKIVEIVSFYEIEKIESYTTHGFDSVIYFRDSKGFYRGLDIYLSPEGYLQFSFYTRNGNWASNFSHLRIDHMKVTSKLLELHFDVFNLPEGDYINKATLNVET